MWRRLLTITLIAIVGKILLDEYGRVTRVQHTGSEWTPQQAQRLTQRMDDIHTKPTRAEDDIDLGDI